MSLTEPTYTLEVEGIGEFTFKRQTRIRNQLAIQAQYETVTGGLDGLSQGLSNGAMAYATLKVLTVGHPPAWNLEDFDLTDPIHCERLMAVWGAVNEREAFFRTQRAAPGQGRG